ncbi:MAG TPA: DUF6174 domain-containing protein [Terriglobales bacterium]|nr:DUF6174 domain-containing protein [Terriglobales bacterium]
MTSSPTHTLTLTPTATATLSRTHTATGTPTQTTQSFCDETSVSTTDYDEGQQPDFAGIAFIRSADTLSVEIGMHSADGEVHSAAFLYFQGEPPALLSLSRRSYQLRMDTDLDGLYEELIEAGEIEQVGERLRVRIAAPSLDPIAARSVYLLSFHSHDRVPDYGLLSLACVPTPVPTHTPTSTPTVPAERWRAELETSRRLWAQQSISSYRYDVRQLCYFCNPERRTVTVYRNYVFEVRDQNGERVDVRDSWDPYLTIDEIFALLSAAIARPAHSVGVRYHLELGYPESVYIDYEQWIADEETGYQIYSLEAITPAPFTPTPERSQTYTPTRTGTPTRTATLKPFRDNGDGTVIDLRSGVVWEKKSRRDGVTRYEDLHDADNTYPWSGLCADLSTCSGRIACAGDTAPCSSLNTTSEWLAELNRSRFAGYGDWRLPTAQELGQLFDDDLFTAPPFAVPPRVHPEFNTPAHPDTCFDILDRTCSQTVPAAYWTSTFLGASTDIAWTVRFSGGWLDGVNEQNILMAHHLRAVRGP